MDAFSSPRRDAIWRAISTEEQLMAACAGEDGVRYALAAAIARGGDPLGEAFSRIRNPATRRLSGATYTPSAVVAAMVRRIAERHPDARRIVDCGAGSGRFAIALAWEFPEAEVVAVEADPLACMVLSANIEAAGLGSRVRIENLDFRKLELPSVGGQTLFVGNPPYVRHHDIPAQDKDWLSGACEVLGLKANRLSGLHVHFFVKILQLAVKGDAGLLITSAEWMESAYGKTLRDMLAGPLGCTHVFAVDPKTQLFEDAQVSSAITEFEVGTETKDVTIVSIPRISGLGDPEAEKTVLARNALTRLRNWTNPNDREELAPGWARLGAYFSVHRGQVTGGNDVWIAGTGTPSLPDHCLTACVTKATDLIAAGPEIGDTVGLKRVVTLPADIEGLCAADRSLVDGFLEWAKARGGADSYTARTRKPWWSVAFKQPAPILCTYMGRRPPVFVRNLAGVAHVNIAHGLYPRAEMTAGTLDRVSRWLNENPVGAGGKTYGGGLRKFEPKEIERIAIPIDLFEA
ncbi:methyltransferase [Pararhizobium sp. BT-229]|uniref:Eco57I restriction-modification methylase domain-containing protein n=1 Tax=Pararhizobium sp. BT-229 TaxID=2986923 RepID=UPI0021F6D68E|nr:methyltransferase domain-containing protein [Pararhizobium sp. BT-229]MCV9964955.1 methyltransferase [Pararhizobium sp. BT-229]